MTSAERGPRLSAVERAGGDVIHTLQRWKEADYRLVIGAFVVLVLVVFRLMAIPIDVRVDCEGLGPEAGWLAASTCMDIYQPSGSVGRYQGAGARQGQTFCTSAPGYLLGTDRLARPLALTLVEASEAFFEPALLCCAIALFLGTLLGAIAGYFRGGFLEIVIRFFLTIVASYPRLIIVIVAIGIFTAGLHDPGRATRLRLAMISTILGLAYVPVLALAIYQKVGSFQREQFVEAARAHGLSHARILGYHILWANCTPVIARHFFYLFGYFVLVETSLSWLGYGVAPPMPSWGNLLRGCDLGPLMSSQFIAPVACILVTILGLQLLGDAIGSHFERGHK
jgi:peptide/nickel transport system permease protein